MLYSKLPSVLHSALDEYLGDSTFDYVPFSRVWDLRGADLTVPAVSVRIGASTPGEIWSWHHGLVTICAENEAHKRLLELVAQFPCHLSESSRRPQAESAVACETDSECGIFDAKITQVESWAACESDSERGTSEAKTMQSEMG